MKVNRLTIKEKRILYNLITGLILQVVTFLLAFFIPRLFLLNFGSEIRGMIATITQVFAYLWLLEAGVGLATVQALYAPVSRRDRAAINSIMTATNYYYKKTGYVYLVVVFLFAILFCLFSDIALPRRTIFLVVLMQGVPNALSYMIQGKYRLLLEAEGKAYILNNIQIGLQFFVNFGKVILLFCTNSILLVQSLSCIASVIQISILLLYIKKHYKWLDVTYTAPNFEAISQKSSVLIHQISGVIFNNTDTIILSMFCGFKTVSVYTVYQMFFSYIETLITTLSSSITFSLGQLFHIDREQFCRYLDIYETLYLMLAFILNSIIYVFILPIIRIYTHGISDIEYVDHWLPLLFCAISILSNGKLPANQVIVFAECFSATKSHALIEAAINLSVSFIAVIFWGIYGGLIGTVAALLFRGNIMICYANRKILYRSPWITYKKWMIYGGLFGGIIYLFHPVMQDLSTYGSILLWGCAYGGIISVIYLAVTCVIWPDVPVFIYHYVKERRS